jgi:hypothetical protein
MNAGISVSAPPVFFGTAEITPRITFRPFFRPRRDVESGDAPADIIYTGEEAFIFAEFTAWDEDVLACITARPFWYGDRGVIFPQSVGTLMVLEKLTYNLYVMFPFAQKSAFRGPYDGPIPLQPIVRNIPIYNQNLMPPGYRFLSSYLTGPDEFTQLGSRPRKISLAWHATPVNVTRAQSPLGGPRTLGPATTKLLYDFDMGPLVGVPTLFGD